MLRSEEKRLIAIGQRITKELGMEGATAAAVSKRVLEMRRGLRVISTWAACDDPKMLHRDEAMKHIEDKAMKSLGK